MTPIVACKCHRGVFYALHANGDLYRRPFGGTWQLIPLGEWPEVA